MLIYKNIDSLQEKLSLVKEENKSIGFVPTMGALHRGHLALAAQAIKENDVVVISIFVNPTQFDKATDLEKYPRTFEGDISLLESLDKTIIVFAPEASQLYGNSIQATSYDFSGIENEMEGKHRQGHFDGVGTVLNLFFRIIMPSKAYFGEKDFQQLQIVKKLVEIEQLPIDIIGCSIVREKSGLAMSSRNKRLSIQEKEEATLIYKTLLLAKENFNSLSLSELNNLVKNEFNKTSLLELEYFEIADINTLKTAVIKKENTTYRAFIACFISGVRLIDNMALN